MTPYEQIVYSSWILIGCLWTLAVINLALYMP